MEIDIGGLSRWILVMGFIAYAVQLHYRSQQMDHHVGGHYEDKWKPVADAFRKNLEENWERSGGAFVVYHKGQKVVDIWGGYSDKESRRPWREDTLSVAFSCSKAMGALVVAKLVDEGRLSYDDLVTKHWPEFGQNGKDNVTVRWLIGHKAGLAYTDHPISKEDASNLKVLDKIFESQKPNWPPGTRLGYHAVTYGWLVDALVRRCDAKKRSVAEYFRQEIAQKYYIDFHLGLPVEEQYRVARIVNPSLFNVVTEFLYAPKDFNLLRFVLDRWSNGTWSKVEQTNPWLEFVQSMTLNDPELHRMEQIAVLGIGTARSMAEVFELLRTGKLMSADTRKQLLSNFETSEDVVSGARVPRGQGLMLREFQHNGVDVKLYGHAGYGGQNVRTDFDNQITIAYLSNGLKLGFGDTARTYKRLLSAVYDVVIPKTA